MGAELVLVVVDQVHYGACINEKPFVNMVVGIFFIIVLLSMSAFMAWESWLTLKRKKKGAKPRKGRADHSAISNFSARIQRLNLPPMIKLSASGA